MNVKMMQVGPLGTNCYILEDEKTREAAVIDPGGDAPEIIRALEGAKLRYILLTHGHYDHTGGAAELERAFPQAALYIHQKDLEDVDPSLFPLRTQIQGANLYDEGAWIAFGGDAVKIQVLHTPGHSEGSVTLRCGDLLFCGDTLFAGSCGRWDLPGGGHETLAASLARLEALDGDYKVCPGHGHASTLERERRTNPCLRQALGL